MKDDLSYMSHMTDSEINQMEMRVLVEAIDALRGVSQVHGMHDEHYDPDWMDQLDLMIQRLRHRDSGCLRLQRHLGELAVPAESN